MGYAGSNPALRTMDLIKGRSGRPTGYGGSNPPLRTKIKLSDFCSPERSVSVLPREARQSVSFVPSVALRALAGRRKRFAHFQTKGTQ